MGVDTYKIGPMFIGSTLSLFLQLGFSLGIRMLFSVENNRFIDYLLILPTSKHTLIIESIVSGMIEIMVIIIPLFLASFLVLPIAFSIKWFSFIIMLVSISLFFASFFLATSFLYSFNWFFDNLWPRRLTPLWWFGAGLFIWHKVYEFWPMLGYLFLLNPITYAAEGLRSALLPGSTFIPVFYCSIALILFSAINYMLIMRGMRSKLDPI
jgi:ABC-type polysaccharide/polyol phosphate export permease